jgi:predicted PurR-regulated permease PerM
MTVPIRELPRMVLAVLFIGIMIVASVWIMQPFVPSLIWSTLVVVATWRMMLAVQRRLWGKRSLAVIVMTTALLVMVILPIALSVLTIIDHADEVSDRITAMASAGVPPPPAWVNSLPMIGSRIESEWQSIAALDTDGLQSRIAPYAKDAARWTLSKAGGLAAFFVHLMLTVFISALLYAKGEAAARGLRAFARRLAGSRGDKSITLGGQAIRAVALGVVVTALVQALLGGIGLKMAGVPLAGVLTAVMFVLAVAQIGAGPVLALSVIWLYANGETSTTTATIFLVWSIFVGAIDNVLRPLLIRSGADLPLVLIFAGVVGGLIAFGIVGLFVGPVILAIVYTELTAWVADTDSSTAKDQASLPPSL